nr:immunoglobulin light chain junction region [Macaca mulatta]MOV94409.1 immunoglobulin light chain junction region [Macaca mulatta]MOV94537.1 immunoglobulin light chain junction region [Macaca mulatta]MOV94919.1 immunoglobulin light chain junction region [Macaca mulatta]MOV94934.1 immunoglobulin light chain junction region [Macaca mulatta]
DYYCIIWHNNAWVF